MISEGSSCGNARKVGFLASLERLVATHALCEPFGRFLPLAVTICEISGYAALQQRELYKLFPEDDGIMRPASSNVHRLWRPTTS